MGRVSIGCTSREAALEMKKKSPLAKPTPEIHRHLRRAGINQFDFAFGFTAPGHLLWKLAREIARLRKEPIPNDENPAIRVSDALNAAMTAWHMCDWVVHYFRQRSAAFGGAYAKAWLSELTQQARSGAQDPELSGMQSSAIAACPELELCQVIATRTKHRDSRSHKGREAQLSLDTHWELDDQGSDVDRGSNVVIYDGGDMYFAYDVLVHVHGWWRDYLRRRQIIGPGYFDDISPAEPDDPFQQ